jgi:hypothetical protein
LDFPGPAFLWANIGRFGLLLTLLGSGAFLPHRGVPELRDTGSGERKMTTKKHSGEIS